MVRLLMEKDEGFLLKSRIPKQKRKNKAFESLAGSVITAGENVEDLIKMANREENWGS